MATVPPADRTSPSLDPRYDPLYQRGFADQEADYRAVAGHRIPPAPPARNPVDQGATEERPVSPRPTAERAAEPHLRAERLADSRLLTPAPAPAPDPSVPVPAPT